MTLPNFLIIGVVKAGTTSIHLYMGQHPQVFMSPVKETNIFLTEGLALSEWVFWCLHRQSSWNLCTVSPSQGADQR